MTLGRIAPHHVTILLRLMTIVVVTMEKQLLCDYLGGNFLNQVTILSSLVTIGLAETGI